MKSICMNKTFFQFLTCLLLKDLYIDYLKFFQLAILLILVHVIKFAFFKFVLKFFPCDLNHYIDCHFSPWHTSRTSCRVFLRFCSFPDWSPNGLDFLWHLSCHSLFFLKSKTSLRDQREGPCIQEHKLVNVNMLKELKQTKTKQAAHAVE